MGNRSFPVFTRAEMKEAERRANAKGTSYEKLMENAGCATAKALEGLGHPIGSVLLLCGSGNNAGDAFVLARKLAPKGINISFLPLGEILEKRYSPLAALNLSRMPENVQRVCMETAPWHADVLVDAVYGTGFHGELPAPVCSAFRKANRSNTLRISLDIPSGLDCDTGAYAEDCFCALHTFCFGAYKPALLKQSCTSVMGQVHLLDIGL